MREAVIALGFFDGVHLGHGALLRTVREIGDSSGWEPMAVSFLGSVPGKPSSRLTPPAERVHLIHALYGVETILLPFTKELMEMTPQAFVEMLIEQYGARHLVAGYDFTFGYRGAGNADVLHTLCAERKIGCTVVPGLYMDGVPVSTSRIRGEILAGHIRIAVRLLGHPVTLTGTLRECGVFLPLDDAVCPPVGVYVCRDGAMLQVSSAGYVMLPPGRSGETTLEILEEK